MVTHRRIVATVIFSCCVLLATLTSLSATPASSTATKTTASTIQAVELLLLVATDSNANAATFTTPLSTLLQTHPGVALPTSDVAARDESANLLFNTAQTMKQQLTTALLQYNVTAEAAALSAGTVTLLEQTLQCVSCADKTNNCLDTILQGAIDIVVNSHNIISNNNFYYFLKRLVAAATVSSSFLSQPLDFFRDFAAGVVTTPTSSAATTTTNEQLTEFCQLKLLSQSQCNAIMSLHSIASMWTRVKDHEGDDEENLLFGRLLVDIFRICSSSQQQSSSSAPSLFLMDLSLDLQRNDTNNVTPACGLLCRKNLTSFGVTGSSSFLYLRTDASMEETAPSLPEPPTTSACATDGSNSIVRLPTERPANGAPFFFASNGSSQMLIMFCADPRMVLRRKSDLCQMLNSNNDEEQEEWCVPAPVGEAPSPIDPRATVRCINPDPLHLEFSSGGLRGVNASTSCGLRVVATPVESVFTVPEAMNASSSSSSLLVFVLHFSASMNSDNSNISTPLLSLRLNSSTTTTIPLVQCDFINVLRDAAISCQFNSSNNNNSEASLAIPSAFLASPMRFELRLNSTTAQLSLQPSRNFTTATAVKSSELRLNASLAAKTSSLVLSTAYRNDVLRVHTITATQQQQQVRVQDNSPLTASSIIDATISPLLRHLRDNIAAPIAASCAFGSVSFVTQTATTTGGTTVCIPCSSLDATLAGSAFPRRGRESCLCRQGLIFSLSNSDQHEPACVEPPFELKVARVCTATKCGDLGDAGDVSETRPLWAVTLLRRTNSAEDIQLATVDLTVTCDHTNAAEFSFRESVASTSHSNNKTIVVTLDKVNSDDSAFLSSLCSLSIFAPRAVIPRISSAAPLRVAAQAATVNLTDSSDGAVQIQPNNASLLFDGDDVAITVRPSLYRSLHDNSNAAINAQCRSLAVFTISAAIENGTSTTGFTTFFTASPRLQPQDKSNATSAMLLKVVIPHCPQQLQQQRQVGYCVVVVRVQIAIDDSLLSSTSSSSTSCSVLPSEQEHFAYVVRSRSSSTASASIENLAAGGAIAATVLLGLSGCAALVVVVWWRFS